MENNHYSLQQLSIFLKYSELGLNQLGGTGIRNYYNTNVTLYAVKTGNGKALVSQLSKHTLETHLRYYDNSDVYSLCEQYFDVTIGDLDFNGNVVKDFAGSIENTVENGCGYCKNNHCNNTTMFDCFLCENFITTLNNKNVFEYEIDQLSNKIYNEQNEHEREFLVSKKRLLVAYLAKIIELEKESEIDE